MNCSCYIFASSDASYTQYPSDDTKTIFKQAISLCTEYKQLIVHRDEQLMYYCFIQKLDGRLSSYVGICVMLNDILVTDLHSIYSLLERTITNTAVNGSILDFTSSGIRLREKDFSKNNVEINQTFHNLCKEMDLLKGTISKLPPLKYGVERASHYKTELSDKKQLNKSLEYGYHVICNNEEIESSEVTSILKKLDEVKQTSTFITRINSLTFKDKCIIVLVCVIFILITIIITK